MKRPFMKMLKASSESDIVRGSWDSIGEWRWINLLKWTSSSFRLTPLPFSVPGKIPSGWGKGAMSLKEGWSPSAQWYFGWFRLSAGPNHFCCLQREQWSTFVFFYVPYLEMQYYNSNEHYFILFYFWSKFALCKPKWALLLFLIYGRRWSVCHCLT